MWSQPGDKTYLLNKQLTPHSDFSFKKMTCQCWLKFPWLGYAHKGMKLGKDLLGYSKDNNSHTLIKEATFIGLTVQYFWGVAVHATQKLNVATNRCSAQPDNTLCTAFWPHPTPTKRRIETQQLWWERKNPNY